MSTEQRIDWPDDFRHPASLETPVVKPSAKKRLRALWWEILETALLTLVLFVVVRVAVLNFKVDGLSMSPTLDHGQYLLINRFIYWQISPAQAGWVPGEQPCQASRCYLFHPPQRGDIVVFWPPTSADRPFIKRVIGLPGETVELRDGVVVIDGVPLDEPYLRARASYSAAPALVPEGHYYVLGDNRNNSSDSHLFGMLPADQIIGQAWVSYWPAQRWGVLPAPTYPTPGLR